MLRRVYLPLLKGSLGTALLMTFVDVMKEMPITLMTRRPIAVTGVSQSGADLTAPEVAELRVTRGVLRWFAGGGPRRLRSVHAFHARP